MKYILAVDPGYTHSAYVLLAGNGVVSECGKLENKIFKDTVLQAYWRYPMAIEMIASYGMPVGKEVFETCVWIGRFIEVWGKNHEFVYRKDVKMALCGTMKAKDSNIRKAILDRYDRTGGGAIPQIGTKKRPGPLYGVSKDIWAALAVGIYYQEKLKLAKK